MMEPGVARSVRAMWPHPVLSGNAYQNIGKHDVLEEELAVSDTMPVEASLQKIKVVSADELLQWQPSGNAYEK